jgi:hypothetical protein
MLRGMIIFKCQPDGITPKKFKDLTNTTLEKIKIKNVNDVPSKLILIQVVYGIRLTRNRLQKEYIGQSE